MIQTNLNETDDTTLCNIKGSESEIYNDLNAIFATCESSKETLFILNSVLMKRYKTLNERRSRK